MGEGTVLGLGGFFFRCGDPEAMVPRDEMRQKFHACADPVLGADRASALRRAVENLVPGQSAKALTDLATAAL